MRVILTLNPGQSVTVKLATETLDEMFERGRQRRREKGDRMTDRPLPFYPEDPPTDTVMKSERRNGMRADVFKDEQGEWRFRVVTGNNEPVAQSEGYKNQGDAKAIAVDLVGEENVRVLVEKEDR